MFECMMRGYNAYITGVKFTECPHKQGSEKWFAWTTGWINSERLSK